MGASSADTSWPTAWAKEVFNTPRHAGSASAKLCRGRPRGDDAWKRPTNGLAEVLLDTSNRSIGLPVQRNSRQRRISLAARRRHPEELGHHLTATTWLDKVCIDQRALDKGCIDQQVLPTTTRLWTSYLEIRRRILTDFLPQLPRRGSTLRLTTAPSTRLWLDKVCIDQDRLQEAWI